MSEITNIKSGGITYTVKDIKGRQMVDRVSTVASANITTIGDFSITEKDGKKYLNLIKSGSTIVMSTLPGSVSVSSATSTAYYIGNLKYLDSSAGYPYDDYNKNSSYYIENVSMDDSSSLTDSGEQFLLLYVPYVTTDISTSLAAVRVYSNNKSGFYHTNTDILGEYLYNLL